MNNIRKLEFSLTESGITPNKEVAAGVQGEHNPTEVEFSLSAAFRTKLANYEGDIVYRFDIYDADGCVLQTDPESIIEDNTIKEKVSLLIGEQSTRFGGRARIYLIVTVIDPEEDKTVMEWSSAPAKVKFADVPAGREAPDETRESIATLAEAAKRAANLSQDILDEFEALNPIGFEINASGHLIVTLADGNTKDLGNVKGEKGDKGDTGATGAPGPAGQGVPSGGTVGQVLTKNSGTNYDTEWRTLPKTVPLVSGSDMAAAVSDYPPAYSNGAIVQCSSTYGSDYLKGLFYRFFSPISWIGYWMPVNVDFYRKTGEQIDKSYYQMMTSDVDIFFCTADYEPKYSLITDDTAFHQGYSYLYTGIDNKTFKKYFTRINTQPSSGGGTPDYPDLTNKPKINNVELSGNKSAVDLGLLGSSDTLAVGSVEVDVNSIKPYDYEQTYTIPNNITSGSTVRVEFAHGLREFTLEITTPETVIAAGTGYFYLTLDNGNGGGRFWEPALGQSHASKLCVSFTVGRDGIYRLNGYKYDLTNNSDYSLMTSYNTLARQNIGRLFLENPRPIASIYFTSGGDISELAGSTIKVRGLKW